MPKAPAIEMRGITKVFGSVVANKDIDLTVERGEIHALLGENGSGKSTLMNMLCGIYSPDAGSIAIDGKPCRFSSPQDAIASGVGMTHQHFKLVDVLTAAENIIAGCKNDFLLDRAAINEKIRALAAHYGLSVEPQRKIYEMSVGEKQSVEILKMLYRGAEILILDEPTTVLAPQEVEGLFAILRSMRDRGCAIIIITHKLQEVLAISDRVTILRRGECAGTVLTAQTSAQELTERMVGREVDLHIQRTPPKLSDEPVLQVKDLCALTPDGHPALRSLSLTLYGGEILGVAGIAGNGQRELCEIIAGLYTASSGSVDFMGQELVGLGPIEILRRGVSMSFVPEDRLGMGLVGGMDITNNVLLRYFQKNKGLFIDYPTGRQHAEEIVEKYSVSTPSIRHTLSKLSGGNIQKVLLGREVELQPRLLITAYPVRGLDIGASYLVYDVLNRQKEQGVAVLFIGEDLDVLMQLCDRLLVLHQGEVIGVVDPKLVSKEEIGLMMLGRRPGEEESV